MKLKLSVFLMSALVLSACGGAAATNEANKTVANTAAANDKTANTAAPVGEAKFPFADFPAVETTAKAGEVVLVPSFNWIMDATEKGGDKVTFIWYQQTMANPGKEMSEVKFMSNTHKVPNAYIVPIAPNGKAKKGDILLTWWQTGSGLQRAIVVDDANPSEPVVRYLDLSYDNPAKAKDGVTSIGQMEEKLKPNSFVKINAPMEPGSATAIQDGADMKHGQVIRVAGEKVFVKMFAGKVGVFDKSKCQPVPLVPDVKEGDSVKAERNGRFSAGKVSKVDAKIGRVWVKFDGSDKDDVIAFGDVMK